MLQCSIVEQKTKANCRELFSLVQIRKERKVETLSCGVDLTTLIVFPILTNLSEFAARATGLNILILPWV